MQLYINRILRDDIELLIGGSISQTAAHKTDSKLSVSVPVGAVDLQECDYIKITDGGVTVLAGTILGMDQRDRGTATDSLDARIYDLTIASNADYIARVFVDLQFAAGANMTQIIRGNHSGQAWYNSALGDFYGIFEQRLAPEGITLGTIDDFTKYTLSDTALLWGSYVLEIIDQLSTTAGAYWEITPDMVFNMRYNSATTAAPFALTNDADIYDLEPSRDAYTMYSAVRVAGGKAAGLQIYTIDAYAQRNVGVSRISSTQVKTTYPINNIISFWQRKNTDPNWPSGYAVRFGYAGIDDSNANIDALITYGSQYIKAMNGYTFFDPGADVANNIEIVYQPLVTIFTRLQLDELVNEVKTQRGGSGIIEATLTDDTISSFADAAATGANFLRDNAKRATSVKFKTRLPGFGVGQIISNSSIPYYQVTGDYKVGAVTASVIGAEADSSPVWEYQIEASNIDYRDNLKALFYTEQRVIFKIGTDFPAADGRYVLNEVTVQSTLTFGISRPSTWAAHDALGQTWTTRDALGLTWAQFENAAEEWAIVANILVQGVKNVLAAYLNGENPGSVSVGAQCLTTCINGGGAGTGTGVITAAAGPTRVNSDTTTVFYFGSADNLQNITGFDFNDNINNYTNAHIDVAIDKRVTNPRGPFALTITKRDVII